jgi:hypothetical protein
MKTNSDQVPINRTPESRCLKRRYLYVIIIIIRISHFSALAGKYSPILGCIINRIRLGGLTRNVGNFLQFSMCQELPLFASVYMCFGAG